MKRARMGDSCRIVIADDHEVVRQGLKSLLAGHPGWDVCGEAADGREAVQLAQKLRPDIVVLDVSMPSLNGLDAARQITKAVPDARIIILTVHQSEEVVREVLLAGAKAYLLKSDAGRELIQAIETLLRDETYFTPFVRSLLLDKYLEDVPETPLCRNSGTRLSPREREVVQLLAEGKSNKEVAGALGISVKTAETHRTNILRKLGLHSLSELVRYAIRNNLVEP